MDLVVFDLEGTLVDELGYFQRIYSETLTALVEKERGERGLAILEYCRQHYAGKGELALMALNIAFWEWAERIEGVAIDFVAPQPQLVEQVRALSTKKVVYTGAPEKLAFRVLSQLGFEEQDFDLVLGWRKGEVFPLKWTCSSWMFEAILERLQCSPNDAWSIGDNWKIDLEPAKTIGMHTALIGRHEEGSPGMWTQDILVLLETLRRYGGG